MILCDGGTSYSKVYDTYTQKLSIIPTKKIIKDKARLYDYATGHSTKRVCLQYVNELIALSEGGLELVPDQEFTILDIGSRDMKYVTFKDRELYNMDWNNSCGGNIGFTVEVLGKYYDIDYDSLNPANQSIPVACGLLGIEKVFDEINKGLDPEIGISKFIKGIAKNSYIFAKKPAHLYLSGGFSLNQCFVETLKQYCRVDLLGRDVLIRGLIRLTKSEKAFQTIHN